MPRPKQLWPKFVQITGTQAFLYGLDEEGGVWKYCPAKGNRFAFWSKLTAQRSDGSKK